jgi:hypothetical protein
MHWKGFWTKRSWPNLRYYHSILMKGLRKTTKNSNRDSLSPGRGFHRGPPDYEAWVWTLTIPESARNSTLARKQKESEENLSQCHLFYHKSHMDRPGREPGPARSQAVEQPRDSWHDRCSVLISALRNLVFTSAFKELTEIQYDALTAGITVRGLREATDSIFTLQCIREQTSRKSFPITVLPNQHLRKIYAWGKLKGIWERRLARLLFNSIMC